MAKALLIRSYTQKTGSQGVWNALDDAVSYVQGINTGRLLDNLTSEKINALISGVPSPWARAKLFKFAFDTLTHPDPNIEESGLVQFYQMLTGEWKGLTAVLALFGDRVRFSEPVYMSPQGNEYDIASAFGRMLFSDTDLWSNQDALAHDPTAQPFIHLIYYNNHLIGGTSPLTAFFTAIDYTGLESEMRDVPWYRNGLFEDPTRYLNNDQLNKVYLFVHNINQHLSDFEKKINSQRGRKPHLDIGGFKNISRTWETDLVRKGNGTLAERGPVAQYDNLSTPFAELLESRVPVYLKNDGTFTYTNDGNYQEVGDIQGLLSSDHYVVGWQETIEAGRATMADGPVYLLKVEPLNSDCRYYFSLPLSQRGLEIFRNNLSSLLGYTTSGNTRLVSEINNNGRLAVTLTVEIDGQTTKLNTREYEIGWMDDLGKVILWPNFVSQSWNKYYLYSEFTTASNRRFLPIFSWDDKLLTTPADTLLTSEYDPMPNEDRQVEVKRLVNCPPNVGDGMPRYNIISVNKPVFGLTALVKENGREVGAGYLICRRQVIEDRSTLDMKNDAEVGFDFGSNNTCVYYNADDRGPKPIMFENYRAVLVGKENDDPRALATNDELLFFSNYLSNNGQVKSWLHEQSYDNEETKVYASDEVAGGVPVYRPNVRVESMNEYHITTQAGTLHYNMKWLDDDKGVQKKRAFLKSVWLQTCAYLYKNRLRPTVLNWSFPGSMMQPDVTELDMIFSDLCKLTPIDGCRVHVPEELTTEAQAVCSFALSQDFALQRDEIFLGIDVGGSTSDILLLAINQTTGKNTLLRESSVRMAAGVFFGAVTASDSFRRALLSFHNSKRTNVYVENIADIVRDPQTAPYYLNSIFDQLKTQEDYNRFYSSMNENAKFVFSIPAYVTGALLYYSGMLIGKTLKTKNINNISRVTVLPFGKGGRLFHWLPSSAGDRATKQYYSHCLNAGFECTNEGKSLEVCYRDEIADNNKAEVAMGLCNRRNVEIDREFEGSDICGEQGVVYTAPDRSQRMLNPSDELMGDYFANEMNNFSFTSCDNFVKFASIFLDFVSNQTRLYPTAERELRDDMADVRSRISACVTKDREYVKARKNVGGDAFRYHQPIFMVEAICMLDVLIKKAFRE